MGFIHELKVTITHMKICEVDKYCITEILISVIQYNDVNKKYLTKERKN